MPRKSRKYVMQRWTGREWEYHSRLTATEIRHSLSYHRVLPSVAAAMTSLDSGEAIQIAGYRFTRQEVSHAR